MRRTLSLIIMSSLLSLSAFGYYNDIPEDLKVGANSVVERHDVKVEVISKNKCTERVKSLVTILNSNGRSESTFLVNCNSSRKLSNFQAIIYDSSGKIVRKIGKGDLKKTDYSSVNLADDSYYFYYEFNHPTYPYTILTSYETEESGFISFIPFMPQTTTAQSVVSASYTISFPDDVGCRYKCFNTPESSVTKTGANSFSASFSNLAPIIREPYMPKLNDIIPQVIWAPAEFSFHGTFGSMKTWEDFGVWGGKLAENRDILSSAQKAKIHELCDTCTNQLSTIKTLYKYLTDNTRYVSIQLGIGGFRPEEARRVGELGYGDCKGLSNYMKAMLKEMNIHSDYAIISTTFEHLYPNFANARQLNHAVLCVPQTTDTIWLECTSYMPVGYIHESITGHEAILASEQAAKLVKLPKIPAEYSKTASTINMVVNPDFSASVDFVYQGLNHEFEGLYGLTKASPDKQTSFFKQLLEYKEPKLTVNSIVADLSSTPSITASLSISLPSAGKKTANRLFIMADPVHNGAFRYDFSDRKNPIHVSNRNFDTNLTITIPEDFTVESMPKAFDFQSEVGTISLAAAQNGNVVTLNASVRIRDNDFPADKAVLFKEFFTKIRSVTDAQIVLKK